MEIIKTTLENLYEVTIYDYIEGKLELLRTQVIFVELNIEQKFLKEIEALTCGEELSTYLEEKNLHFLTNYDPIETDAFLYEELFLQENKEFLSLVLKYNSINDVESLKDTQQTLESDKVHFVPEDEIPF
jgi:hypothetical protein